MFLRHVSLEYGAWRDIGERPVTEAEAFCKQCDYISRELHSLESVIFWFLITEKQYTYIGLNDERDTWYQAAKCIKADKVDVVLFVFRDPGDPCFPCHRIKMTRHPVPASEQVYGGTYYQDYRRGKILANSLSRDILSGLTWDLEEDLGIWALFVQEEKVEEDWHNEKLK